MVGLPLRTVHRQRRVGMRRHLGFEHCARWAEATTVTVSHATMCRALRRLDLSLTKRR